MELSAPLPWKTLTAPNGVSEYVAQRDGSVVLLKRVPLMHVRSWLYRLKRWLYRSGRPNWIAGGLNRLSAAVHALGIAPNYAVTLEVRGRRSGRIISLPLVMVVVERERYLVSMLGADVDWVKNVKAADGHVVLRHGRREEVRLEEVPPERRAPMLKAYLKRAPGARPHIPVQKDAPLSEFEQVAGRFPVFRVVAKTVSMSAK